MTELNEPNKSVERNPDLQVRLKSLKQLSTLLLIKQRMQSLLANQKMNPDPTQKMAIPKLEDTMKSDTFDRVFKICLLVLLTLYVGFYCYSTDNRRYEFGKWSDQECVRDTKNGNVYITSKNSGIISVMRFNGITGDGEIIKKTLKTE